jgi:hypothetical protein
MSREATQRSELKVRPDAIQLKLGNSFVLIGSIATRPHDRDQADSSLTALSTPALWNVLSSIKQNQDDKWNPKRDLLYESDPGGCRNSQLQMRTSNNRMPQIGRC